MQGQTDTSSSSSPSSTTTKTMPHPKFEKLKEKIHIQSNKRVKLQEALGAIVNQEGFDPNDVDVVQRKLFAVTTEEDSLMKELVRREDLYDNQIKNLIQTVNDRAVTLDRLDIELEFFEEFPDLEKHFINKQAELSTEAERLRSQLELDLDSK
jgi:hypothetical protein